MRGVTGVAAEKDDFLPKRHYFGAILLSWGNVHGCVRGSGAKLLGPMMVILPATLATLVAALLYLARLNI